MESATFQSWTSPFESRVIISVILMIDYIAVKYIRQIETQREVPLVCYCVHSLSLSLSHTQIMINIFLLHPVFGKLKNKVK